MSVTYLLATGRRFSLGSYVYKTDSHDITEILLKVGLNCINQTKPWFADLTFAKSTLLLVSTKTADDFFFFYNEWRQLIVKVHPTIHWSYIIRKKEIDFLLEESRGHNTVVEHLVTLFSLKLFVENLIRRDQGPWPNITRVKEGSYSKKKIPSNIKFCEVINNVPVRLFSKHLFLNSPGGI